MNKMEYTKSPPIVEQAQTWIWKEMVESQHHEQTQAVDTAQKVLFLFLLSL